MTSPCQPQHTHTHFNKKTSPFSHSQPRHFSQHTNENPSRWGASGQQDLKDHSKLQKALGVRTNELHQLSPFATFVPASVALCVAPCAALAPRKN